MTEAWDAIKKAQKCLWKFSKQRCQVFGMDCFLFWLLRRSFKLLESFWKQCSRVLAVWCQLPRAVPLPVTTQLSNHSVVAIISHLEMILILHTRCIGSYGIHVCQRIVRPALTCKTTRKTVFCSSPLWYHSDLKSLEKEHVHYRCRSILSPEVKSACWNELSSVDAARLVSGLKEKWSLLDKIRKQSID